MTIVEEITLPRQAEYEGKPFPLVLQWDGSPDERPALDWLRAQRIAIDAQATEFGAILFRNFPIDSPEAFDSFIRQFEYPNFPYEQSLSNAVRVVRTERVFSANEAPPEVTIFLHHEMAQTPIYPSRLFFYCEHAAAAGGATPICRSDVLLKRLQQRCPQFVEDCEQKGLRYTNVMPAANDSASGMGRSWQSTLRAQSPAQAEQRLRELEYSWQWLADGCLQATTPVLPAIRRTADGRNVFFNQLIAAFKGWKDVRNDPSKAITYGDGSPLDAGSVHAAAEIADDVTFDIP